MKASLLLAAAGLLLAGCGDKPGKATGAVPGPVDAGGPDIGETDVFGPDIGGTDIEAVDTAVAVDARSPDGEIPDGEIPDAGPATVKALYGGLASTCALFTSGRLKCWGANNLGQLGLGDQLPRGREPGTMGAQLPLVDLGAGAAVAALAIGGAHACALLATGVVKCWGDNSDGQLGAGKFQDVVGDQPGEMGDKLPAIDFGDGRKAVAIAAGPRHSCAVLEGGAVKCWGSNLWGNLGLGMTGFAWPPEPGPLRAAVDSGTGRRALAVSAGGALPPGSPYFPRGSGHNNSAYACALLDTMQIKCWGGVGVYGAVGEPSVTLRGEKPEDMGDNLPALAFGGRGVRQVVMGAGHGCALLDDQRVRCWGNNHQDQIGRGGSQGTAGDPYVPVNVGPGRTATAVAVSGVTSFADEAHSCAVLDDGSATCWGANWHGQLGQPGCPDNSGGTICRGGTAGGPLPPIDLGPGSRVQAIAPGGRHTCALLADGRVKCWGDNGSGQLGLEDTTPRGKQAEDMGDRLPAVQL